ncbi:MAG: SufS family cysteine desulfurase [Chromatiaceae bacterium]|nr:MAG: SufS family cysteine desulfurase [Chromatiaceae bacterium]
MLIERQGAAPPRPFPTAADRPIVTSTANPQTTAPTGLELPHRLRAQFPILQQRLHGRPIAYLDNAASTQKPHAVIAAVADYYRHQHANIHRGAYQLSQDATAHYEAARARVAEFLHAADPAECIFTRGTTEAINLVAQAWGGANLQPGDEIILTELEHHANIVPWQMLAERTGACIRVIPIDDRGELQLQAYQRLLSSRTRLVAVTQVSNALGTINPVAEIIAAAHAAGALVLIDGAQWVAHGATDVQALDADFYAFSGHKLYGPTGIGVLYGKRELLEAMPPWQGGGDMIERVSFDGTTYAGLPNRFEAGTPHIAGAIGLAAAIDWVLEIGFEAIAAQEQRLLALATKRLAAIPGLALQGAPRYQAAVLSWIAVDPPVATLDLGLQLDLEGICIRTGHHCCQPLMERLGLAGTARASFAPYNDDAEVERLAAALEQILQRARRRSLAAAAAPVSQPARPLEPTAAVHPVAGSAPVAVSAAAPGGSVADPEANASVNRPPTPLAPAPNAQTLAYPPASAASPAAAAEAIADLFEALPDWPMRYQQLIELGDAMVPLPAALKTPAHAVSGCQSQVHLVLRVRPGSSDIIEFRADSDAGLVRGLIALLQQLFSGQEAAAILAFDAAGFFARIGLDRQLSLTRRTGLDALLRRVRQLARAQNAANGTAGLGPGPGP